MKLAIAIPTFNRAELLRAALLSVGDCPQWIDIHVFDNASQDHTAKVCSEYGSVRFHPTETNCGYVANINRCLSLASDYQWIRILHSDDLSLIQDWARLKDLLGNLEDAGLVFGGTAIAGEQGQIMTTPTCQKRLWQSGAEAVSRLISPIPCSSTIYSGEAVLRIGGFDPAFEYCADEEYNARVAQKYDIAEIDLAISAYRRHEGHFMIQTWGKPDFLDVFETMRLKMNSYLPEDARLSQSCVRREIGETLVGHCSALCAGNHFKLSEKFYAYLWKKCPSSFLKPAIMLRWLAHSIPGLRGPLCRALSQNFSLARIG